MPLSLYVLMREQKVVVDSVVPHEGFARLLPNIPMESAHEARALTSSLLAPDDLEALLYDWHNSHSLVGQQADIGYWLDETRASDRILVLSAGTGRVAAPLAARGTAIVVALDLSLARLARIPAMPRLARVCADMTAIPLSAGFDSVVVPYSAFQLLRTRADRLEALRVAAGALSSRGVLHIDVSTSFDSRPDSGPQVTLAEFCPELGEIVTEVTECTRDADSLVLCKEFRDEAGEPGLRRRGAMVQVRLHRLRGTPRGGGTPGRGHRSWLRRRPVSAPARAPCLPRVPGGGSRQRRRMSAGSPRIDVAYFKLFDNCNARCNMCDCWLRPRSSRDLAHYLDVLERVLAARPRSIRFTGGEPLLLRGLPALVATAAKWVAP